MIHHRFGVAARSLALTAAALAVALLLGGCVSVNPKPPVSHSTSGDSVDHPAHPLSDDDAKAQVINAGREIVAAAHLQGVGAGFEFASCNDQGDPPYMGQLQIVFDLPPDTDPDNYFQTIAAALTNSGWTVNRRFTLGPKRLDKAGVSADIGQLPLHPGKGSIDIYGECRNMTDHHHDGKTNGTNVTAEIQ